MPNSQSEAFRRFIKSFKAPLSSREWIDSFDLAALTSLEGDERREAEDLLIEALAKRDDGRVAQALAVIECERAVPALHDALQRYSGETRVWIAAALSSLEGFDPTDVLIDELRSGKNPLARSGAAQSLASLERARVEPALLDALEDRHEQVRRTAIDALLTVWGLARFVDKPFTQLSVLPIGIRSSLPSVRRLVRQELEDIRDALDGGDKASALGQTTAAKMSGKDAQTLLEGINARPPGAADIDLGALDAVDDAVRAWAEHLMLYTLHEGDSRLPRALAHLGAKRAIEPLRELREQADGPLREAIDRALEQLAG